MIAKRVYPFGRVQEDSVAQPFRNSEYAHLCAEIMQRMTGEETDVIPRGRNCFILLRFAGEQWIRA
jgi:hypothetical protein